jgi:hypothetical protein
MSSCEIVIYIFIAFKPVILAHRLFCHNMLRKTVTLSCSSIANMILFNSNLQDLVYGRIPQLF